MLLPTSESLQTKMTYKTNEEIFKEAKINFEANFLDGDKIQDGQMLASSECFEAIKDAISKLRQDDLEAIMEWVKQNGEEMDYGGYVQWILSDKIFSHLKSLQGEIK